MYYKSFTAVGVANTTVLDGGLTSLVEAPVHVNAVLTNLSVHAGNMIECWIGNKRVMECFDYLFDTQEETAGATAPFSQHKISRLPIELDIPAGEIFKIGVRSGAAGSTIFGAYEYTESVA